jgi:hypothetical protein
MNGHKQSGNDAKQYQQRFWGVLHVLELNQGNLMMGISNKRLRCVVMFKLIFSDFLTIAKPERRAEVLDDAFSCARLKS